MGENLHNHVSFTLPFTINRPNEFDLSWPSLLEYIAFTKGPIASTGLSQLTGIVSSIYTSEDDPDLQIFFGGYQAACATTGQLGALMDGGGRHVSISPTNLHPRSRGTIPLPFSPPLETHPLSLFLFFQAAFDWRATTRSPSQ